MPRKEPAGGQTSAQAQQEAISEGIDSFELPRSLVTRIARSAVSSLSTHLADPVQQLIRVFPLHLVPRQCQIAERDRDRPLERLHRLRKLPW